jgi:hypothetical protein
MTTEQILQLCIWPVTTIVIVIIVIIAFKRAVDGFINKAIKINAKGVLIETQQPQANNEIDGKTISDVDRFLGLFREETVEFFREIALREGNLEKQKESEKIPHLIDHVTAIFILWKYSEIYYSIYGSQIKLLQKLNSNPPRESETSLKKFYEDAVLANPDFYLDYSYEAYLGFLYSFQLIANENKIVKITFAGNDFLKFLIDKGKTLDKAF